MLWYRSGWLEETVLARVHPLDRSILVEEGAKAVEGTDALRHLTDGLAFVGNLSGEEAELCLEA